MASCSSSSSRHLFLSLALNLLTFVMMMAHTAKATRFLSLTAKRTGCRIPSVVGTSLGCSFVSSFQPTRRSFRYARILKAKRNAPPETDGVIDELSGYKRPTVNWYPGHIAKAERQLAETLKAVDVVVEVRDARACKASSHPKVGEWCAGRPRIVVLTHLDTVPKLSFQQWKRSYDEFGAEKWDGEVNAQIQNQAIQARGERFKYDDAVGGVKRKQAGTQNKAASPVECVKFVDAKQGQGIHSLNRSILKAGSHVQERRERRGLQPRPLRVGIIGYPNVGKSALINRILGRRRARTADTPGVTRSLQWIRVRTDDSKTTSRGKEFELLDSPGIIPANMVDQSDALLLAACNCVGDAAYDNQAVAAYLFEWLKTLHIMGKSDETAPDFRKKCKLRYGFDPLVKVENMDGKKVYLTGEDMLFLVADNKCKGDAEDASRKMLQDFRRGRLGAVSLQLAPREEADEGQQAVRIDSNRGTQLGQNSQDISYEEEKKRQARAEVALERAKEQGLELPSLVVNEKDEEQEPKEDEVGKGLFDGW